MQTYKAPDNSLHAIDPAFAHLLPPGCVAISDEDVATIQAPSIEQSRANKWVEIKAERDRRSTEGGVKVADKWFHSDLKSKILISGIISAGIPPDTQWKTMDGSFIQMTQTLAQEIGAALATNELSIFAAAQFHKVALEASEDPSSYDFSGNWPPCFFDTPEEIPQEEPPKKKSRGRKKSS